MIYILACLVAFGSAFLKIFQHKNINGNHLKAAFGTSYMIAAFDVTSVTLIVTGGWWMILPIGTGGAIGVVLSAKLHDRIFSRERA